MKQVKLIVSVLFFALIASPAFSNIITDTMNVGEYVGWGFDSTSYTHNINDDGFILGSALSGTLSIAVSDDADKWYEGSYEKILFTVENFDGDTGGITLGTSFYNEVGVTALAALNGDGLLDITITSLFGDFWVGESVLSVMTEVPEPATLGLMMIGLLSLVFARRRTQA